MENIMVKVEENMFLNLQISQFTGYQRIFKVCKCNEQEEGKSD